MKNCLLVIFMLTASCMRGPDVRVEGFGQLSDGQQTFNATVTAITDNKVTVDLNHPLAGEDLLFKGIILESRPATEAEIDAVLHPKCKGCSGGCKNGDDCNCEGGCGDCK